MDRVYGLANAVNYENFDVNGAELCALSIDEFEERCAARGGLLYFLLQQLRNEGGLDQCDANSSEK